MRDEQHVVAAYVEEVGNRLMVYEPYCRLHEPLAPWLP